jgi:multidrug efflux pump subunit AcrB
MFFGALAGFGNVKNSFFPDSTRPQLLVDFWFPSSTHIDQTTAQVSRAEEYLLDQDGVKSVASFIGGGQIRFLLTYTPEKQYSSFAQALITVDDYKQIPQMLGKFQHDLEQRLPGAIVNTKPFILGPSKGGKIQLRIYGPDPTILRELAGKAEAVITQDPVAKGVYSEWFDMQKVLRPKMAEAQARRLGIDRPDLASAMAAAVEGTQVGVYRERDELLPVIARSPAHERSDFDNLDNIQVWSPAAQQMVPAAQVTTGFAVEFENPYIWRRDRATMIRLHADAHEGLPSQLFARIKPLVEQALNVDVERKLGESVSPEQWDDKTIKVVESDQIPIKGMPEYYMAWGGEAEDSARAQASIAGYVPIFFGAMILMVIILFNSIRKTLVIWLTVPMAIIGVTIGLLTFDQPFSFMALLGLMSLAGMLIKNAIVLIDQIDAELNSGKPALQAVLDSGVSRLIPVAMAAMTTILGMLPLLTDAFFVSMAVTIMFGLGFATLLTLVFVPVLYAIFFNIKSVPAA